ncbi:MAG: PhoH family protein [Pseudomonadota bacterium]|uniref:PhoH family protein n=1 Tax=Fodinicurvata fenggangensis TaxID=1121830 RepID=UPI0006923365|nr:PhoH family protein [Fodinicurvata fenggangensis]
MTGDPLQIEFDDNSLLPLLFGQHDENLVRLERQLGVSLSSFGNLVTVSGPEDSRMAAKQALQALYQRLKKGMDVDSAEVDAAARLASGRSAEGSETSLNAMHGGDLKLITRKRHVTPRSPGQIAYVKALLSNELVFGIGPAGTGKTYLAVATAVSFLMKGQVDRIILSRPAVEAGERLGFLPGDMKEKVDPYLRPLYDALHDLMPGDQVARRMETGEIEIAPLAFMRGRTLSNAFVILDEAQNSTPVQMKMFLTRLGENGRMVVTGDLSQVDLPRGQPSGLRDAAYLLAQLDGVGFVQFTDTDVVRHPLVTRIVRAYENRDAGGTREKDLFERSPRGQEVEES